MFKCEECMNILSCDSIFSYDFEYEEVVVLQILVGELLVYFFVIFFQQLVVYFKEFFDVCYVVVFDDDVLDLEQEVIEGNYGNYYELELKEDEDFFVEEVDGKDVLYGLLLQVLQLMDVEIIECDVWELVVFFDFLVVGQVIQNFKIIGGVKFVFYESIEDEELVDDVDIVQDFNEYVQVGQVCVFVFVIYD